MIKYLVVFEKTKTGYSAFVPDLPGCISTGRTRKDIEKNIQEAIEFHVEGLKLDGEKIPEPTDNYAFIKVKPPVRNTNKERITLKKKVN
jgi:predicted RNase H-like HicB family nuclease